MKERTNERSNERTHGRTDGWRDGKINELWIQTINVYIPLVFLSSCRYRCLPNGTSVVEVIIRLGPEAGSDSISSLQTSIKGNDGELELSNGASARLVSVEILTPGLYNA